jgi:hypothetical protein
MVRPIEKASIHLFLKEVLVHIGRKVMMEVDDNILLIVDDPQGILDEQLRLHPIHLLKNNIITLKYIL